MHATAISKLLYGFGSVRAIIHSLKLLDCLPVLSIVYMRGSRKFCQRGSKFDNFFFSWWGIEDPNTAVNGQSSARQRNAIAMAFRWRPDDDWLGSFDFFQGIRTTIAKKPFIFVIFMGGGGSVPPVPPMDPLRLSSRTNAQYNNSSQYRMYTWYNRMIVWWKQHSRQHQITTDRLCSCQLLFPELAVTEFHVRQTCSRAQIFI